MHPCTLLTAIILVHLSVVSGLPIASLPRETASIYSHAPNALSTQNPDQGAKADDLPRKHTISPSEPSKTRYLDPVASRLASKLSAINHQLSRFPIVQSQSTAEGKGAKSIESSTKRRMEKPTATHKHKHHHKATLEKEAVHPRSSIRLLAVQSAVTSHNIKFVSATATATTPHTSSTPVVIPNPKATNPTTKPTTKAGSTAHFKTSKVKTKSTATKPTSYTPRRSPTPTTTSTSKPKSSTKSTKTTEKIVPSTTAPIKMVLTTTLMAHPGEPTGPGRYYPIAEMITSRT